MRFITLILFITVLTECNEIIKHLPAISIHPIYDSNITTKKSDSLKFRYLSRPNHFSDWNKYTDKNSFCKLSNDSLIWHLESDIFDIARLTLSVFNDSLKANFYKIDCTSIIEYPIDSLKVSVNKKHFVIGDTITSEIFVKAIRRDSHYGRFKSNDTVIISGVISLKIREANFDAAKLNFEVNGW